MLICSFYHSANSYFSFFSWGIRSCILSTRLSQISISIREEIWYLHFRLLYYSLLHLSLHIMMDWWMINKVTIKNKMMVNCFWQQKNVCLMPTGHGKSLWGCDPGKHECLKLTSHSTSGGFVLVNLFLSVTQTHTPSIHPALSSINGSIDRLAWVSLGGSSFQGSALC